MMSGLPLGLLIVSAALAGVGTFLYNDGRDHKVVGGVGAAVGVCAAGLSLWIDRAHSDEAAYQCGVYRRDCPSPPDGAISSFWEVVWDVLLSGILLEIGLVGFFSLAGFGVAMCTRRTPADGRQRRISPPD